METGTETGSFYDMAYFVIPSIAVFAIGFVLASLYDKRSRQFEDTNTGKDSATPCGIDERSRSVPDAAGREPAAATDGGQESPDQKKCPRCSTDRREMQGVLDVVLEDEYGNLYRCPDCGRFYNFELSGGPFKEVALEWVRRIWPHLKMDRS